ncbi:MAG: TonB-dependent receptor [Caulobacterales bacterium]|nr:TonB-dependent receptor [Caulobacterales bacterium]
MMGRVSVAAVAAAMCLAPHGGARAQDDAETATAGGGVDTITVTARRREESIQETPISITAFDSEALRALSASDISGLGRSTPNLDLSFTVGTSGGGNSQATIRGIGQTDFLITTDPGVGIYLDGVYLGRTTGSVLDLADVERVEVLRGPQGTLYGRNTIGGAINVITADPTEEFEVYARATVGEVDRADLELGVSGPLVPDVLRGRLSAATNNRSGYAERVIAGDDLGNEREILVRGGLLFDPSDTFSAELNFDYARRRQNSTAIEMAAVNLDGSVIGLWNGFVGGPAGTPITPDDVDPDDDPFTTRGTGTNVNDLDQYGVSATLEWDLGGLTVKSITGYRDIEAQFGRDGDNTPIQYVDTNNRLDQDQFSQELQLLGELGALSFVAGAYYFDESATDLNDVRLGSGLFDALEALPTSLDCLAAPPGAIPTCPAQSPGVPGGPGNPINLLLDLDIDVFNQVENTSYAVFGDAQYDLSERVSVNGGLRYTREDKEYTLEHIRLGSGVPIIPLTTVDNDYEAVSGRVGADFQVDAQRLLYASASRGFKSGGFNGRPTAEGELEAFDPEFVWAYEVGLKSDWLDRALRVNTAFFYTDYSDIQLQVRTLDPVSGTFVELIENAGAGRIYGVELEALAAPTDGLLLNVGVGFLETEYTDIGEAEGITLDSALPRAPDWNLSLGGQYSIPMLDKYELTLRGDYFYTSEYYQDIINTEEVKEDGYGLLNLRAMWSPLNSDSYELAAFVTNATDELYIENGGSALDSFGVASYVPGRPREWGVSLTVRR